jgi:hypothetical protein
MFIINFLKEIFGFQSLAEDGIKYLVYTVLGIVLLRMWKSVNGWKPEVKQERKFWALGVPMVLGLVVLASGLVGARSGSGAKTEIPSAIRGSVFRLELTPNGSDTNWNFRANFNLRLTNPGKPTTVWAWTLRVKLLEGQQYEYPALDGIPMPPRAEKGDPSASTNAVEVISLPSEYLPFKLLEHTVGGDKGAVGWVSFDLKNIPRSQLTRNGTKFEIEIEQSDGSKRTIEHEWKRD